MEVSLKVLYVYDVDGPDRRAAGSELDAWAREGGGELEAACAAGLKPCLGCFGCWLKTPGRCVVRGDAWEPLFRSFLEADLVLLGGAIPYGSFAPPVKAVLDRWLPALLPYFRRFRGEMHHVPRYDRLPRILSIAFGEASAIEEATHLELARAFCDNAASPRQERSFRYRVGAGTIGPWLSEELAS
jgi:multimeric flavodoxin WrbA